MPLLRIQMTGNKFGIIFLDITHMRFHKQFITVIHFLTNGVQRHNNFCTVRNYRFVRIRQFRQIMTFQIGIDTELHHLRVDHDELQFRRMLPVQ